MQQNDTLCGCPYIDHFPLFPTTEGRTPSKYMVVNSFRKVISELGVPIDRIDPRGDLWHALGAT